MTENKAKADLIKEIHRLFDLEDLKGENVLYQINQDYQGNTSIVITNNKIIMADLEKILESIWGS